MQPSSRAGFRGGIPNPGSGGPAVPLGPSTAAGLGALQGPVQPGLNPAHALGHSSHHALVASGLGVASQGADWEAGSDNHCMHLMGLVLLLSRA